MQLQRREIVLAKEFERHVVGRFEPRLLAKRCLGEPMEERGVGIGPGKLEQGTPIRIAARVGAIHRDSRKSVVMQACVKAELSATGWGVTARLPARRTRGDSFSMPRRMPVSRSVENALIRS